MARNTAEGLIIIRQNRKRNKVMKEAYAKNLFRLEYHHSPER